MQNIGILYFIPLWIPRILHWAHTSLAGALKENVHKSNYMSNFKINTVIIVYSILYTMIIKGIIIVYTFI